MSSCICLSSSSVTPAADKCLNKTGFDAFTKVLTTPNNAFRSCSSIFNSVNVFSNLVGFAGCLLSVYRFPEFILVNMGDICDNANKVINPLLKFFYGSH